MALNPLVVHIGGIDEVAAMIEISIHYSVGLGLVGVAAKDITAKAEWMNYEVGFGNSDHVRTVRHN